MGKLQEANDLLVIMGVSGSGKSTIASLLSQQTGWMMIEGDSLHPAANQQKMAAGEPLTNDDRMPWIDAIAQSVNQTADGPILLACSALNNIVRDRLMIGLERSCCWIFLDVPEDLLAQRIKYRTGHFMPASLLQSQLEALDPPADAIRIDGTLPPERICEAIRAALDERIEQ